MHQHVLNWRRSKPCLAGVMESRRRLHWLSGFGGPGGKSRIRSTCPDILLYANIRWSWVGWREKAERQKEGKKIQHTLEKGKEAKGKRKVNREGHRETRWWGWVAGALENPAEGTSSSTKAITFMMICVWEQTFPRKNCIFYLFLVYLQ